ncbi:hypothetical protein B0H15DRAFT_176645 [Mycena belliarum]|uniref:Protein kinase domain-containing protein n=1 Tax=Mycena belliarum TaxID=1033014 RepID=A0AAD6TN10_9AGAR|nr:hypothetical protein B0H15DRAFT_176645 [Mycena belliae]
MHGAAYDAIFNELLTLFDYRPPPLSLVEPLIRPHLATELTSFYDRHLDDKLSLKYIRLMPSLLHDVAYTVTAALEDVKSRDIELPSLTGYDSLFTRAAARAKAPQTVTNATDVATFYRATTSKYCQEVASVLAMHPRGACWATCVSWRRELDFEPPLRFPNFEEEFTLRIREKAPNGDPRLFAPLWGSLDPNTQQRLRDISARFSSLAVWQVFTPCHEVDDMMDSMETLATSNSFFPMVCGAVGLPPAPSKVVVPPDARTPPWTIPLHRDNPVLPSSRRGLTSLRRSVRLKKVHGDDVPGEREIFSKDPSLLKGLVMPPKTSVTADVNIAERYLQHAWARATALDSTFIILYSGNSERICFRHRATQTLYISDFISPRIQKDPGYGKIHAGLYTAILLDVVDRLEQLNDAGHETPDDDKGKRKTAPAYLDPEDGTPKRRKLDSASESSEAVDPKIVYERSASRKLALLTFRYGVYNSQNPASFIRSAPSLSSAGPCQIRRARVKKNYALHEYMVLSLTSEIERGATGIVHGGTLELSDEEGNTSTAQIVVKLSFSAKQREKLRHEYTVYHHMAGVEGVVTVLGLFEDIEDGPLAMVMSHAGVSLRSRPAPHYPDVVVSDAERVAFLRALDAIHAANVRHHDIRPENMLIDDTGRVTIIDFDLAELNPSRSSRKREREHMVSLLNDDYVEPRSHPSAASSPDPETSNSVPGEGPSHQEA